MSYPLQLERITLQGRTFELFVPLPSAVQDRYAAGGIPFPYWSKIWPSAIALGDFLLRHTGIIRTKNVVEIGAGLGLPSLLAAPYARAVHCSDYLPEPVAIIRASAEHLAIRNLTTSVEDWSHFRNAGNAQVVLASDINYAPHSFDTLYQLFTSILSAGTTIVLSTPHRMAGKAFAAMLAPHCTQTETMDVGTEPVSVFVLK